MVALARPRPWSLAAGLALGLLGEAMRLWAAGHIEKTRVLATGGPYAHTRNPLYLGSTLMAAGIALAAATPWAALAAAVYLLAFYPAAIRGEAAASLVICESITAFHGARIGRRPQAGE